MGATEFFRWDFKFICILLATYLNRAATVQDSGDASLFTLHTALRDGDYYVRWKVNGEYITFETTARTTGYVALGFSTNGGMAGSDIIIGWVNDGEVIIQDYHAIGEEQPLLDESQDVEVLGGTDNGTFTTLRFRRKLETCDDNDYTITEGTVRLLWAFRDGDPDPAIGPQYHVTNRGAKSAYLLNPVKKEDVEPLPDDTYAIDIINDKVHIQNKTDTTYWCQGFKLPEFNGIHHLIRIEPIIQPGHEALIHHINVYGCFHDLNQTDLHLKGGVCNTDNMPDDFKQCKVLIMGWAFGGEAHSFPPHVGFPLGGPDDPQFVKLEVHYDNPTLRGDYVDSSGLRFIMTPRRRQYDAGILLTGVSITRGFFFIPPHFESFYASGQCSSASMSEAMASQPDGIKVFAVCLHTHLTGTGVWLRHIRDGVELPNIIADDHYDFNYQGLHYLNKEVTVLPNDTLVSTCRHKTTDRNNITWGGYKIREEMCFTFPLYYPRIPKWQNCVSMPSQIDQIKIVPDVKFTPLRNIYVNISEPKEFGGDQFLNAMENGVDWTNPITREMFQQIARNATQIEISNGTVRIVPAYKITTPYKPPQKNCPVTSQTTSSAPSFSCLSWIVHLASALLFSFKFLEY